jgi:hypothetical protein
MVPRQLGHAHHRWRAVKHSWCPFSGAAARTGSKVKVSQKHGVASHGAGGCAQASSAAGSRRVRQRRKAAIAAMQCMHSCPLCVIEAMAVSVVARNRAGTVAACKIDWSDSVGATFEHGLACTHL